MVSVTRHLTTIIIARSTMTLVSALYWVPSFEGLCVANKSNKTRAQRNSEHHVHRFQSRRRMHGCFALSPLLLCAGLLSKLSVRR